MDGMCSTQEREEKCIQSFSLKTWRTELDPNIEMCLKQVGSMCVYELK
jgi:hypothetical protein